MANTLASAWISVAPDLDGFAAKAIAGVKAALKGAGGNVAIGADTSGAAVAIAKLKALIGRSGLADFLDINVPVGKIQAQLQLLRRLLNQSNITDILGIDVDKSKLTAQLAEISKLSESIPVSFDVAHPDLAALTETITVAVNDAAAKAEIDADTRPRIISVTEAITQAIAGGTNIGVGSFTELTSGAGDAAAAFGELEGAKDKLSADVTGTLNPAADKAGGFLTALGITAGAAGGWFGVLGAKIPLFGGALGAIPFLGAVSGFHLLADSILEVGAVVIPAGVALAAFGVAAASTVNDIVNQEKAFLTITTALGTSFPGLSSGLQHFTDSVKPEVWTLFGEALNTINAHTGLFQQLATGAGLVLDNLGARAELALGGSGLNGLIAKGVSDLQLLGNIIGNVFGILGNVLHTLPGIAEILFGALQDVTGALEAVTSNGIVQGLLGIGLAFHGAVLWGGLLATALIALSATGIVDFIGLAVGAIIEFTSALIAGQGALLAFDILADANPFALLAIGIGAVVAGAIALVSWLGSSKSAADQLWSSIEKNVGAATTYAQANEALGNGIKQANSQLATTPKYIEIVNNSLHGMNSEVTVLNPAWLALNKVQQESASQQQLLTGRFSELDKITGSYANTVADLSALGVKAGAVATLSAHDYALLKTEIQGLASATLQLSGYTAGPAAAAQNALTNLFLNEQLPAIQKITQAETNLLDVITGGQTAFNDFQQSIQGTTAKFVSPSGLADAAMLAKGNLSGLNQQSLAFSNTLYTQSIPALQQLIGSLQQQSIGTGDLTKVVATGAGQMLQYTGTNKEAQAVIVGLINNALGKGTVSLQNLNSWVKQNSTSLTGMNNIVAQSTIKAGTLASVLQNQLNVQFHQALLQTSGASGALKTYTSDLVNNTSQTAAGVGDRAKLIADLVNSGLSAKQATAYVNGLSQQIGGLKGKTVDVGVTVSGSGGISDTIKGLLGASGNVGAQILFGGAQTGMKLPGYGGGDIVPILAEPGEAIVSKETTKKFAGVLKAMGVPGFAGGGLVSTALNNQPAWAGQQAGTFAADAGRQFAADAVAQYKAAVAKAQLAAQAAAVSGGISSAGVSNASAEMALASAANKMGWGGSQWAALYDVEMREAGFSLTATNPTSGAYGMAQFINGPSEYAQYGGNSTTAAGQATAMVNYIAQRYGNPQAAWNHELAYGWYDQGGWLPPGASMAINNTGQAEKVTPGGKLSADAQFLGAKIDVLVSVMGQQGGKFATSLNSLAGAAGSRGSYSTRR